MSRWIEPKIEDIDIDGNEINIYIGSDDFGNNYVVLKISEIKKLIYKSKINQKKYDKSSTNI